MEECSRDWSVLNSDLLVEIAVRVLLVEDFMAMRGVCSSWRVAVTKNSFKHLFPSVPLLMLPGNGNKDDGPRFYSLSRRNISMRLRIPKTVQKRCFGVGFGWLLIVSSSGDVSLLNPFSQAHIQIPSLMDFEDMLFDYFDCIAKAVLSADPSKTSNFVLLALFNGEHHLGFWRVGDELWNEIEGSDALPLLADIVYYKEKFYAVDSMAKTIWVLDPCGHLNPIKVEMRLNFYFYWEMIFNVYMVESSGGELLLITSHYRDEKSVVEIRRWDVKEHQWEQIASLGNDAVFVGDWNASISVSASNFPDFVEPNCIYFATYGSDYAIGGIGSSGGEGVNSGIYNGEGKNMGVYNVEDGSTKWLVFDQPPNRICPPVWIAPSF